MPEVYCKINFSPSLPDPGYVGYFNYSCRSPREGSFNGRFSSNGLESLKGRAVPRLEVSSESRKKAREIKEERPGGKFRWNFRLPDLFLGEK